MVHKRDFLHNTFGHEGANRLHAQIMAALDEQARQGSANLPSPFPSPLAPAPVALAEEDSVAAPGSPPTGSTPGSPTLAPASPAGSSSSAAGDAEEWQSLSAMVMAPLQTPAQQIASGRVPAPTNVAICPTGVSPTQATDDSDSDAESVISADGSPTLSELYSACQELTGLSDLYAAYWATVNHIPKYDITDPKQANKAFAAQANSAYQVIQTNLAGVLTISSGGFENFTTTSDSASVHSGLLKTFFTGVDCGEDALTQLDSIMTSVAKALSGIKISTTVHHQTVDQFLRAISITRTNLGDASNPNWMQQAYINCFWLKIQEDAWETQMSKFLESSSATHVDFAMMYTQFSCMVNMDIYNANRDAYEAMSLKMSGKSIHDYGKGVVQAVPQ